MVHAAALEIPVAWIVSPKSHQADNRRVLRPGWGSPRGFLVRSGQTERSSGWLTSKLKTSGNQPLFGFLLADLDEGQVKQQNRWVYVLETFGPVGLKGITSTD